MVESMAMATVITTLEATLVEMKMVEETRHMVLIVEMVTGMETTTMAMERPLAATMATKTMEESMEMKMETTTIILTLEMVMVIAIHMESMVTETETTTTVDSMVMTMATTILLVELHLAQGKSLLRSPGKNLSYDIGCVVYKYF